MTTSSQSSSYAGSGQEEDSHISPIDALPKYIEETILDSLTSDRFDRCIAIQSQSSGLLNAQLTSLEDLNKIAQNDLKHVQRDLSEGQSIARKLQKDLTDLQRRIKKCQELARQKFPEYRVPETIDDDY